MTVNIDFEFAKIYNIDRKVDVVLGQKFSLFTDSTERVNFASINDAVLQMTESNTSVDCEATALGQSTILIMGTDFSILKQLDFNVVSEIVEPATDLGLKADAPELK